MITLLAAALLAQDAQPATPPAPPPPPCESEAHQAFDFWVGEWEVTPNQDGAAKAADSKIEKLYRGCAVRENWMPLRGAGGGSLNSLRPDGLWHQRWVGSGGETVDFVGGPVGENVMVLQGYWRGAAGPGSNPLVRMTYTLREDGSVRQHGEQSLDHGLTWGASFDLIYRRKN
ncbi:hypothetical protein [Sphingomicrobium flavum]|uniref:hypothetical protein n=1 Tax=Sphingomicrobium flavum TaxID=1229164 RepID=UPI0021AE1F95|nr:hypothetical protein [Sphingomicrobium flavum]